DAHEAEAEVDGARGPPLVHQPAERRALRSHLRGVLLRAEIAAEERELVPLLDVDERALRRLVSHLRTRERRRQHQPAHNDSFHDSLKSRPVIPRGCSSPSSCMTVGPTSRSDPPLRKGFTPFESTTTKGTGLVVCAVCGPPVSGSIIISQLPW